MQDKQNITAAEQAAWHAGLDEGRAQAAPAAVAVPAERDPAALLQLAALLESGRHLIHVERKEIADALRAALAATPAAWVKPVSELLGHISDVLPDNAFDKIDTAKWNAVSTLVGVAATPAAAAPVVLPEPWPTTDDLALAYEDAFNRKPAGQIWANLVVLVEALHARRALLATATGLPALAGQDDTHSFKNFHRALCDRFGYTHDPIDWRRDQVSLIEHIAAKAQAQADARDAELLRGLHWATSLLGTPEGDAYQEAMQAEAMKVSDALNGEVAKASIEQYRGILEAGLTAARAAIAAAKGESNASN